MCERVFVVIAERGQADERRFVIEHLIDDRLHGALHLLHVRGAAHANAVDDFLRHGDRPRVRPFRRLLLALLLFDVFFCFERRLDADERYAPVGQFLRELEQLVRVRFLGRIGEQQRNKDLELLAVHAFIYANGPDAALA